MEIVLIVPVPGTATGAVAELVCAMAGLIATVIAEQSSADIAAFRPIRSEVIAVTLKKHPSQNTLLEISAALALPEAKLSIKHPINQKGRISPNHWL
jgi:hypothetical protein